MANGSFNGIKPSDDAAGNLGGQFANTEGRDPGGPWSAVLDAGKGLWNAGLGAVESTTNLISSASLPFEPYPSYVPFLNDYRGTYDTPVFGITIEFLTGVGTLKALGALGEIRTASGAEALASESGLRGLRVLRDGEGATASEMAASVGGPTGGVRLGQAKVRQQLLNEADAAGGVYKCWRCGAESFNPSDMHLGHRNVPTSKGGNLERANVCLEGAACNLSSGARGAPSRGMSCAERGSCGAPYGR